MQIESLEEGLSRARSLSADSQDLFLRVRAATDETVLQELMTTQGMYPFYSALQIKAEPDRPESQEGDSEEAQAELLAEVTRELDAAAGAVARINREKLDLMYGTEFMHIRSSKEGLRPWKGIPPSCFAEYVGVALSGGGIRSASFASGVLQGLHDLGVLDMTGYLSTVSGGGYAGSWYMLREDPDAALAPGSEHLQHLTQYGHYLTGGNSSKSLREAASSGVRHALLWPFAAVMNELVFHYQMNTWGIRDDYRRGIQEAFHYERPLTVTRRSLCGEVNILPGSEASLRCCLPSPSNPKPFWIINAHVSLEDDPQPATKNRSGDAFELTPLRAGSKSTGYVTVPCRLTSSSRWMTPAYGVAISGAAADSTSWEQGWLASNGLYALNLDLGYYVDSWKEGWLAGDDWAFWKHAAYRAKGLMPLSLLRYVFPDAFADHRLTTDAKRFALTDGGHFDNLGIYALVARGCRLIIVSDATADPKANDWTRVEEARNQLRALAFDDFREVETRLSTDFGVKICMEWEEFDPAARPSASGFTDQVPAIVFKGTIPNLPIMPAGAPGEPRDPLQTVTVIYIKSAYDFSNALRRSGSFVDMQKANYADFPNESTADQFFSELQVASYRRLGYEAVVQNSSGILGELRELALKAQRAAGR